VRSATREKKKKVGGSTKEFDKNRIFKLLKREGRKKETASFKKRNEVPRPYNKGTFWVK